ncbi:sensor histidine kinase N-terminal domain-containing protein [Paucibacter sp. R3-3]|uniref:histidine kinase n=1 Tax=Roseateles agri TaxID=3098619 RepID=A0ABU5DEP0_9BURK|nr:sensor histidine kinase N-terminal domain-containing protein [Paucibacter sp. R3-3]MDY0743622.1 sensor histidine kinase N-terminal domain-containing protein [Paucibacter sp. R3-3]
MTDAAAPLPPSVPPSPPSLRARLLRNVLAPLLLTWLLGTAIIVGVAHYFTERAFDRAILSDAYLLASRIKMQGREAVLDLSPADLNTVLYDQQETQYFSILYPNGRLLAGEPGLDHPAVNDDAGGEGEGEAHFMSMQRHGVPLRGVMLARSTPVPLRIIVAQTTHSRQALLNQLIVYAALPQLVLLAVLAVWLQQGIRRDLAPLQALQASVERRDAADLTPLPPMAGERARTREVDGLAGSVNRLLGRIDEGVRAQREFAGTVAHELRTPLAGLRAAAEYGLAQDDPARWREQLQAVLQGQLRASRLVDQLLALALADEAQNSRMLQPVALGELARDVVLQFLARADRAGVELGASGLDAPLRVMADPGLLEGLLSNLLDNALRYGKPNEGRATLSVDLSEEADGVRLSVTDNGPGIEPGQRTALLLRWKQGSDNQRLGLGAGLGLSIVDRYAQLMQATLALDSGPGGAGLRVSVLFPRLAAG